MHFLAPTLAFALLGLFSSSSLTSASPILTSRATPSCSGITGPFFLNGGKSLYGTLGSYPDDTRVTVSGRSNLSSIWYENGHGGAPCDSGFALGITADSVKQAPSTLLSADWKNDLDINGAQANLIRIDADSFSYGNYTAWFVQYDPSNGNVLMTSNSLHLLIDSDYGRPAPAS